MNLQEATQFIDGIKSNQASPRNYCMMMFFLNLGIRVTELCQLNKTSIQGRYLTVIGKGNKERTVYLNDSCMQALADYENCGKTPYKGEGEEPLLYHKREHALHVKPLPKSLNALISSQVFKRTTYATQATSYIRDDDV